MKPRTWSFRQCFGSKLSNQSIDRISHPSLLDRCQKAFNFRKIVWLQTRKLKSEDRVHSFWDSYCEQQEPAIWLLTVGQDTARYKRSANALVSGWTTDRPSEGFFPGCWTRLSFAITSKSGSGTVPTKYKDLFPELGLCGKGRSPRALLESKKKTVCNQAFFTKYADVSILSKKDEKYFFTRFSQDSPLHKLKQKYL